MSAEERLERCAGSERCEILVTGAKKKEKMSARSYLPKNEEIFLNQRLPAWTRLRQCPSADW